MGLRIGDELIIGIGCVVLGILLFIVSGAMVAETSGPAENGIGGEATEMAYTTGMGIGLFGFLAFIVGLLLIFTSVPRIPI